MGKSRRMASHPVAMPASVAVTIVAGNSGFILLQRLAIAAGSLVSGSRLQGNEWQRLGRRRAGGSLSAASLATA